MQETIAAPPILTYEEKRSLLESQESVHELQKQVLSQEKFSQETIRAMRNMKQDNAKIMDSIKDTLSNTLIDRIKSEQDLLVESNRDLKFRVSVLENKPEAGSD